MQVFLPDHCYSADEHDFRRLMHMSVFLSQCSVKLGVIGVFVVGYTETLDQPFFRCNVCREQDRSSTDPCETPDDDSATDDELPSTRTMNSVVDSVANRLGR